MKRVLAIDPITRGFGFAVLEGPNRLVDWGVKGTSVLSQDANRWCLKQLADLIALYQPQVLVIEDASAHGSRRRRRVSRLIEMAAQAARREGLKVHAIPRRRVARAFPIDRGTTKHAIAVTIAERFPELMPRLPRARKPWMSEDVRIAIFDAAALALAFYRRDRVNARSKDVGMGEASPH